MTNERKAEIREKAYGVMGKIGSFVSVLCRNSISVSNDTEIFSLPIIVFVIAILGVPVVFPAIIISLFCGVEYTFRGEDFGTSPKVSFR